MGESAELEQLLRNIQSGLKKYSIKDLKDGIVSYFNKNDDKTLEINTILSVVSEHFDTTITTLKQKNIEHVLSNSFGFGGNCSTVIFSKSEWERHI